MGGGILLIKARSLFNLFVQAYPQQNWREIADIDIWSDESLANYFVRWLQKQPEKEVFNIQETMRTMKRKGDFVLSQSLKNAFPRYNFNSIKIAKKTQFVLKECIQNMFLNKEKDFVLLEEYKHPDIANLELDYFLPQYNIAFEYQVMKESYL